MKHSAIASPNQMLADIDASDIDLTPKVRGRRRLNRRNMLIAQGLSYIFDASLLGLYVLAGSTSLATPVAYLVCGLTMTLVFMVSSETGLNDRFKDHYLTILQNLVSTAIMPGGIYLAPEVGFVFCLVMFIVFSFSTLRTGALQAGIVWTFATVGLTAILLLTDKQVS
ncbi:MAG: GGDEF domain-containing protein, partial [Oxalobacteraceae bacterium]